MLKATYAPIVLRFNFTAITSRQSMTVKESYVIKITDTVTGQSGVGECALFKGLGADDVPQYEYILDRACRQVNSLDVENIRESSIKFGFETAFRDLKNGGEFEIFPSDDWRAGKTGIPINGLIWMGDNTTMLSRINRKLEEGYRCIKIKIGGIDFSKELDLLSYIRSCYGPDKLELRLDANGSMNRGNVMKRLDSLSRYDIHSIEQPVMAGQWQLMRDVTRISPIDIALDEELIGNMDYDRRCYLLDATMPAYIILKPSLHGGFATCDGWIKDAADRDIGWWATSALESNIGLNAIAQWTASKHVTMPQGLGTGALYENNFTSPLLVKDRKLYNDNTLRWDKESIDRLF